MEMFFFIHFLGASLGDCVTDSFSITTPGSEGTPVICGFNSGQHSKLSLQMGLIFFF